MRCNTTHRAFPCRSAPTAVRYATAPCLRDPRLPHQVQLLATSRIAACRRHAHHHLPRRVSRSKGLSSSAIPAVCCRGVTLIRSRNWYGQQDASEVGQIGRQHGTTNTRSTSGICCGGQMHGSIYFQEANSRHRHDNASHSSPPQHRQRRRRLYTEGIADMLLTPASDAPVTLQASFSALVCSSSTGCSASRWSTRSARNRGSARHALGLRVRPTRTYGCAGRRPCFQAHPALGPAAAESFTPSGCASHRDSPGSQARCVFGGRQHVIPAPIHHRLSSRMVCASSIRPALPACDTARCLAPARCCRHEWRLPRGCIVRA